MNRSDEFRKALCVYLGYVLLIFACVGCGSAEVVSPEIAQQASGLTAFGQKIETKQDAILKAVKDNDTSIKAVWTKLEALDLTLSTLKPQTGKDGDPQSSPSPPESPAQANTALAPLKVATPGTSHSETLVELATRLYAQGVNTHMKTREELEAIDSNLTASKSSPVQFYSRPTYSQPAGTVCVNGRCFAPQVSARRRR